MELSIIEVNSKSFTHDITNKTLTAEHSGLGNPEFWQMYDDACDEGLAMRSNTTGNVTRWFLAETVRDADNDIVCWILHPAPESMRHNVGIRGYVMRIYND